MNNKISIYNPFTDKDVKINPYGLTAKRIYKLYIDDMGSEPDTILPPNLNYNKETGRFKRIKIIKDFSNVRRITYNQVIQPAWSYLLNIIRSYAGQTIKFALKYTNDGAMVEHDTIEDIPKLGEGFSGWWDEFSYFFMIDSEIMAFSPAMNDGLEPNFQAQLLILKLDKVNQQNYQQYFMEGITNCLLKPIREWAGEKLDDAKSKSAKYNYSKMIKDCDKYEKEFIKGVPEDRIAEICNKLQIGIEIDLPSTINNKTKFIDIRSQKKPKKIFKYLNTRLNHIDLNEVKTLTEYEEVDKKELHKIFNDEKDFRMWKSCKSGITQVNTLNKIYKLKEDEGYRGALKEFEENNNLNAFKIEYYDNPQLSQFLQHNCQCNQSILLCEEDYYDNLDENLIHHIDMKKSYTRGADCDFYEGYLGKITDFRKTDKIVALGIYQITNINFNGNKLIEKLKVLHDCNAYPSPELKYYQSMGITFDIIGGAWGQGINIDFTPAMYEKEDGVSHYCRWYGTTMMMNFKTRYNFDCKDIEFAELNHNHNEEIDIRFNDYAGTGIIEYKKKKVYHQYQIASFITSYARINLINQLTKFNNINNIIAVQVDGIYYEGDVDITPLFRKKEKKTMDWIETDYFVKDQYNCKDEYEYPESRPHHNYELHIGAGGCGKTHKNLTDDGLCSILYVAPSWKLSRNKAREYNVNTSVVAWLLDNDPDKWRPIYNKYSTIIIDEISMLSDEAKNDIMERFDNHKIIFCGDLGYQLPPVEGKEFKIDDDMIVVEHKINRRCKCNKLKKRLDFMREKIKEGKEQEEKDKQSRKDFLLLLMMDPMP